MDLHRPRSALVRMTETAEHLETVRISNDRDYLREVMLGFVRSGPRLSSRRRMAGTGRRILGSIVHLAHPLGDEDVLPAAGEESTSATLQTLWMRCGWGPTAFTLMTEITSYVG
jgi:hypothetical protein